MGKAYIIVSLHWEYNDNWWDIREHEPVTAYVDREYAELMCAELNREARDAQMFYRGRVRRTPSEHAGGVGRASTLSETVLLERLHAWRLPPPPQKQDALNMHDWSDGAWWASLLTLVDEKGAAFWNRLDDVSLSEAESKAASEVTTEDLWALFDRVRFFEVEAIEVEET